MKWPWTHDVDADGAHARAVTEQALVEVRSRWPEVLRVAEGLRELRERNAFAAQIEMTMRERR